MSIKENVKDLYDKILTGRLMEGFEQYYADEVIMQENEDSPRVGKELNRQHEQNWLASVEAFHGGGVDAITVDEEAGIAMVECWMELTYKGAPGPMQMREVCRQHWKNGQIVNEKFYYNAPSQ